MEATKIYSTNQLVEEVKKVYPGMKSLKVFINYTYIKISKIDLHFVQPLGFMIGHNIITNEELSARMNVETILFNISNSHYNYMTLRKQYTFWCISIDCKDKKTFNEYTYYNTKLMFVNNQTLIDSLLPAATEFTMDDDEEEEDS